MSKSRYRGSKVKAQREVDETKRKKNRKHELGLNEWLEQVNLEISF